MCFIGLEIKSVTVSGAMMYALHVDHKTITRYGILTLIEQVCAFTDASFTEDAIKVCNPIVLIEVHVEFTTKVLQQQYAILIYSHFVRACTTYYDFFLS